MNIYKLLEKSKLTPQEIIAAHDGEKCRDCGEYIAKKQLSKIHNQLNGYILVKIDKKLRDDIEDILLNLCAGQGNKIYNKTIENIISLLRL